MSHIYRYLTNRQSESCSRPSLFFEYDKRQVYRDIFPNADALDINCSNYVLKKFSHDGKYLLAFTAQQHSFVVFIYTGILSCERFASTGQPVKFEDVFTKKFEIALTFGNELLCKDFCIFTANQRFIILASAAPSVSQSTFLNPSSLSCIPNLDDITFHVIDVTSGKVLYQHHFYSEYIYLSHHSGVHLHGNRFAVTSIQHQCIYLFTINPESGKFLPIQTVGALLYPEDPFTLSLDPISSINPNPTDLILGFKHRLLAFLYRKVGCHQDTRYFYTIFETVKNLIMWKAQFLNKDTLFMKFGQPEFIIGRGTDVQLAAAYYVVYDIPSTQILAVHGNDSEEFLSAFYYDLDCFRRIADDEADPRFRYIANPSNNLEDREDLQSLYLSVAIAKHGGSAAATKKILAALPFPFQCLSPSPFFDPSIMSFDTKYVSLIEKPKLAPDYSIKFFDRRSKKLVFELDILGDSMHETSSSSKPKRYLSLIFHPSDPFVISCLHTFQQPTITNFHYHS